MNDNEFLSIKSSYREVLDKFHSLDVAILNLYTDFNTNKLESIDNYSIKHKIHLLKSKLYSLESEIDKINGGISSDVRE